jgi:hypothetical protein
MKAHLPVEYSVAILHEKEESVPSQWSFWSALMWVRDTMGNTYGQKNSKGRKWAVIPV